MQEIQRRSKPPRPVVKQVSASSRSSGPKYLLSLLFILGFLAQSLNGAFEGVALFRTAIAMGDGILPTSMNNPARLPDQPFWMSIGHGKPMSLDWATYNTAAIGGRWKSMRGAAGIWTSGDKLYSERIASIALAQVIQHRLTAGFAISYYSIDIQDYPSIRGDLLLDGALTTALSTSVDVSVWYSGQTSRREESYTNPTRQLFQLAVTGRIGNALSGSIALEKTPPFTMREGVDLTITSRQNLRLYLGYRTAPETPSFGMQVPVGRMILSYRLIVHPALGLSTAFGLVVK